MNLIQIEREVRKMSECLRHTQMEPEEAKLAQSFAELCAQANQRLLQCASMISAGDTHQALQLAEVRPALLDLITVLAFKQAEEWRARCRSNHLPVAEPLDAKSIKSLNAAYTKGITTNDPMYKEFRDAIWKKDDARALAVVRMIVRLNPGDANAVGELKRLEQNDLSGRLQQLDATMKAGDQKAVFEQIQEIESLNPPLTKRDEIWRRAHGIRCRVMFHELQDLRRQNLWPESLARHGQIRQLCEEFSIELSEASAQEMIEIENWARQQAQNQTKEENFGRILGELEILLDSDHFDSPSRLSQDELKREMEILNNKRRELDPFSQAVPIDVENRFNKILQSLRGNLLRQQARKTRMSRLALAAAAVLVLGAALFWFEWHREISLATTLQKLAGSQQVANLEKLLASIRHQPVIAPPLAAARRAAEAYLNQKNSALDQCAKEVALLNADVKDDLAAANLEQIYRRHEGLIIMLKALPADVQNDPRLSLAAFESRWINFLAQEGPLRSSKFVRLLEEVQRRAQNIAEAAFMDRFPEEDQKMSALLSTLDDLNNTAIPALQIDRVTAGKYHTFREDWGRWNSTTKTLHAPESLAAYLNALRQLQACKFFNTKAIVSAATIASLDMSTWHLKATLILPGGDLDKWTNHLATGASSFFPADLRPAEKNRYLELRDDEQIHQVWLYDKDVANYEPVKPSASYAVYSMGPIATKGSQQFGRIYDPVAYPDTLSYKSITNFTTNTHFKEEGHRPQEYWAYEKIGPGSLIDAQTGAYQTPALEILDRLNKETNSSPLFRAFLAMKLYEIMDVRPVEWGYIWCPAAADDRKRLQDLGAGRIKSGNWYVPNLVRNDSDRFGKYFASARNTSYMKQARFYQTLASRLDAADFSFAGYYHPDGGLVPVSTARGNCLWGFDTKAKLVVLYRLNPQTSKYDRQVDPLPFSPVFCFGQDYHIDVAKACEAAELERTAPSIAACPLIIVE